MGFYTEMQEHPGGEDEEKKNYIFLIEKKNKDKMLYRFQSYESKLLTYTETLVPPRTSTHPGLSSMPTYYSGGSNPRNTSRSSPGSS